MTAEAAAARDDHAPGWGPGEADSAPLWVKGNALDSAAASGGAQPV